MLQRLTVGCLVAGFFMVGPARGEDGANVPAAPARSKSQQARDAEFFETRIRPVLAEHCYRCHGARKQKSGLRLDSRAAVIEGNDAGPVVVPGKPEESPLIEAVRYGSPIKMPPRAKLPQQAIDDLTTWIRIGSPWPEPLKPKAPASAASASISGPETAAARAAHDAEDYEEIASIARTHWSFQPIRDPKPPRVRDAFWPRGELDRFLLARLEERGLAPSPRAEKRVLVRRATFDLTGLPPSPEEIAAFLADDAPDAYARLIDRLLASPRYGERWGRHWLDVARYADTKGYILFQEAEFHWAYTYRDYVVGAFNRDLPYDRFIIEQLAADRLRAEAEAKGGATVAAEHDRERECERERDRRAPLAALGFLTVGPRLMGNVHDIIDDRIDVVCRGLMSMTVACARCHDHKFDPVPTRDYYSLYGVMASASEPLVPPELDGVPKGPDYAAFVKELNARKEKLAAFVKAHHEALVESSRRRAGEYLLAAWNARSRPTTEDFMLIADGNDLNPSMIVRWKSYLLRELKANSPVFVPWQVLSALPEAQFAARAPGAIAQLVKRAEADPSAVGPVVARALEAGAPRSLEDVARIYSTVLNRVDGLWRAASARAALEGRAAGPLPVPALEELRQVFYGPDAPPMVPMTRFGDLELFPDRPTQGKWQALRNALQQWLTTGKGAPPRVLSLEDLPAPVEPQVFRRGNPTRPGERVPRRFLAVLSGPNRRPFQDGGGRLDLARAIASKDNPLTARSLVNRVWMHHFGRPLVATTGDFGMRSDPPTHPDLLDHLASRFIEGGWSVKGLHRMILLSAAYQQRSADRAEARAVDPENALYWRMNRRRLDFEAARDALLSVSGQLDGRIGGPPMPNLIGPASHRRTLYGHVDRLNLPGLFRTFDFPDPNATHSRRDETTIAPQALFLMNNPFVQAAATALARRPEVVNAPTNAARAQRIYQLVHGRAPTAEDLALALDFLEGPRTGTSGNGQGAGPDAAAWAEFAQALLMSNEFAFVD